MNRFAVRRAGIVVAWSLILVAAAAQAAGPQDVADAFAQARSPQVTGADGVPLAVVERGDRAAPAIIFIHGYRQSHLSWFAQFGSRLSARCHLVAYDLRGHGDSGAPPNPQAYEDGAAWAEDLARVIAATQAKKPLLVAWSFGGLVAMDYLRAHGTADIAGVVMVSTTGRLFAPDTVPPRSEPPALAVRVNAAAATSDVVYGPRVDPALRAFFAAASLRTGPFIDAGTAARGVTLDNADLLPRLRTLPVTLVIGSDDAIVPKAMSTKLKSLLVGARVVEFPGSGHAPFVDAADRFDDLLENLQCPL